MTAAYQLRKMGHYSTIFDDHSHLDGMARYGIPGYCVPRDNMDAEIARITNMDAFEVKLNTRVSKDIELDTLENYYDVVLWALDCKKGRGLFVDSWDEVPNAISAVDYLESFNLDDMKYTAPKIVCVGGGDTSIDVVSVSRRIGTLADYNNDGEDVATGKIKHTEDPANKVPCEVTLTSLFSLDQMTAAEHEVQDALIEGVTILNEVMPSEIIVDKNGRAIAFKVVESVMEGNLPKPKEGGKETIIETDLIVSAIGQFGDLEGVEEFRNECNAIDADNFYQVPSKEGHFVAGDIVRLHIFTTAIGKASIAAETMYHYLKQAVLSKRSKVDKHHFDLLDKLKEFNLSPTDYQETEEPDMRGTDGDNYAVHNFDDRSQFEIVKSSELFLGHFEQVNRYKRTEDVSSDTEVLGHFTERMNALAVISMQTYVLRLTLKWDSVLRHGILK